MRCVGVKDAHSAIFLDTLKRRNEYENNWHRSGHRFSGRIVLPKELRTNMHIDKDSKLEIFVEGDQIILKKHRPAGSCDFCGELAADMAQYEGYCICPACRAKIAAL